MAEFSAHVFIRVLGLGFRLMRGGALHMYAGGSDFGVVWALGFRSMINRGLCACMQGAPTFQWT